MHPTVLESVVLPTLSLLLSGLQSASDVLSSALHLQLQCAARKMSVMSDSSCWNASAVVHHQVCKRDILQLLGLSCFCIAELITISAE